MIGTVRAVNQRLKTMLRLVQSNYARLNSSDLRFLGFAPDATVGLVRGRLGRRRQTNAC